MVRHGARLATAIVGLTLAATLLLFACGTLRSRPPENTEGCLLFEATRIRAGLPLYTDPARGAFDYGPVPARYHVLYPPLWSRLLAMFPRDLARSLGRALSVLAWYGVLAWIAWGAHRRGRPAAVLMAAFVGGAYKLALFGAAARPDGLATALAAVALERSVRAARTGAAAAGLFALATWCKPSVLGLGLGAMASQLAAPARVALGWTCVSVVVAAILQIASGGLAWHHLVAATWQPLDVSQWLAQLRASLPFLAAPVALALSWGVAGRAAPGVRIATLALASSVAWTLLSLAKAGSATGYWMEPCLGALIVFAHAPVPPLSRRSKALLAVALPLQALWSGVASIRSSVEAFVASPERARVVAELARTRGEGELFLSDDAGMEMALDGRLVDTPFQTTALVRAGLSSPETWIADIERDEIVGVVATSDLLERPLDDVGIDDRYPVAVRRALRDRFTLTRREAGLYVYSRR